MHHADLLTITIRCGYQLLGERMSDPLGVEGYGGDEPGLGLLPVTTVFATEKRTAQITATAHVPWADRVALSGYEMHMGRTYHTTEARAVATITRRGGEQVHESDGSRSADGRIWGCYLHGIFVSAEFRRAWLHSLGWHHNSAMIAPDPYDRLADRVQGVLDRQHLDRLLSDR